MDKKKCLDVRVVLGKTAHLRKREESLGLGRPKTDPCSLTGGQARGNKTGHRAASKPAPSAVTWGNLCLHPSCFFCSVFHGTDRAQILG